MTQSEDPTRRPRHWSLLTNHAHVLLVIARDPDIRLRDVAEAVGVTERSVYSIVADLEADGYLQHVRVGRRNHYAVDLNRHLSHPTEANRSIGAFLALFAPDANRPAEPAPARDQSGDT